MPKNASLSPRTRGGDHTSGHDLRESAENVRHKQVSTGQLTAFRDHGLIRQRDDGRWPQEAREQLLSALELKTKARRLDRRALYRFLDDFGAVAPEHLKANMISVFGRMRAPVRKLRRVRNAVLRLRAAFTGGKPDPRDASSAGTRAPAPSSEQLTKVLVEADPQRLHEKAQAAAFLAGYVRAHTDDTVGAHVKTLKEDERLVLLTIWELMVADSSRRESLAEQMSQTRQT
jgi:hypothetical protein